MHSHLQSTLFGTKQSTSILSVTVATLFLGLVSGCGDVERSADSNPSADLFPARQSAVLSADAAKELATGKPVELLFFLRHPVDTFLPNGPETTTVEEGDHGELRYRLNDAPITREALDVHAARTRRALVVRAEEREKERAAAIDTALSEVGASDRVVSRGRSAFLLPVDRGQVDRIVQVLGDRLLAVEVPLSTAPGLTDTLNTSGQGALEALNVPQFAHAYNLRGQNIGIWHGEGGLPNVNNSAISNSHLTILNSGTADDHSTLTTILLQKTAPDAMVYHTIGAAADCYTAPSNLLSQTSPPAYLSSHSWSYTDSASGVYGACAATWDDFVYDTRMATFFLAHNFANYVTTPGKGYNITAVGGSDHVAGTMYSGSDYINPETGAMKPDFVAPGVCVTASSYFTCKTGTSVSTPIAAGFAANLMSAGSFWLNQPQAIKAYMLAGATTNIEGAALYSSKDGAGQIDFLNTRFYRWGKTWNGANNSYFDANGVITESTSLTAGTRARVAISWLTPGSYVLSNKKPSMRLTLEVKRGANVYTGALTDETFQLVDFIVPETGTYTINIKRTFNSGVGNLALTLTVGTVS